MNQSGCVVDVHPSESQAELMELICKLSMREQPEKSDHQELNQSLPQFILMVMVTTEQRMSHRLKSQH